MQRSCPQLLPSATPNRCGSADGALSSKIEKSYLSLPNFESSSGQADSHDYLQ